MTKKNLHNKRLLNLQHSLDQDLFWSIYCRLFPCLPQNPAPPMAFNQYCHSHLPCCHSILVKCSPAGVCQARGKNTGAKPVSSRGKVSLEHHCAALAWLPFSTVRSIYCSAPLQFREVFQWKGSVRNVSLNRSPGLPFQLLVQPLLRVAEGSWFWCRYQGAGSSVCGI